MTKNNAYILIFDNQMPAARHTTHIFIRQSVWYTYLTMFFLFRELYCVKFSIAWKKRPGTSKCNN